MSYKNKINCIRQIGLLSIFLAGTFCVMAQEKTEQKANANNISITVVDVKGIALPNAQVVVGEGEQYAKANQKGKITLTAGSGDNIRVVMYGYQERTFHAQTLFTQDTIRLVKLKLLSTNEDNVPLPFLNVKKRIATGSDAVIDGEKLENYQGTNLRNAFTGLVAGLEIREMNGTPGVDVSEQFNTEKINVLLRGRSPLVVVDGMPTDLTEMPLDPSEVESATILKDVVSKNMFGAIGADGIISIKTKHGKLNERVINVNFEKGVNIYDRMPTWVNGTDYLKMNNLARSNNGMTPKYDSLTIAKYGASDGYNMYTPNNNFRDMMFKNTAEYTRANVSSSGGNEYLRYFSYLGYTGEGDIFKIGDPANYSRVVARANLDIKVNDYLKIIVGAYGAISMRNTPNYGSGTEYTQFLSAFSDANTTPATAFPIYANNSPQLDKPWYGVSTSYPRNPIAGLLGKGFLNDQGRSGASNITFDYNMSHLLKGLSSQTYVGFNIVNQIRHGKAKDYIAYTVTPGLTPISTNPALYPAGRDTLLLAKIHDGLDVGDLSKKTDYYFQRFGFSETLNHDITVGKFSIQNSLTYYMSQVIRKGYEDTQRQVSMIWSGVLNYNDKYTLQASVNRAGTYSFLPKNRYANCPTAGASWILSEEDFMKSVSFVNYLKLRAQAGIMAFDNYAAPFYYEDNYSSDKTGASFGPLTTSGTWFGTTTESGVYRTTQTRAGNPDIGFEKRKEFSVGVDALLFSEKLSVEVNYYNMLRDGILTSITNSLPAVNGLPVYPVYNYNSTRYSGIEIALNYKNNIRDFQYSIGGNATIQNSKIEKIDEPNYKFGYQSSVGLPEDAIFGLNYVGKFTSDADALAVPQRYDAVLHAGDLKYTDMNKNGEVDDNDKTMIGHAAPRLYYALNLELKYKSFELTAIGTGRAFYDIALTSSSYFMNGWGDNNYSTFVRDNLTSGNYPKLTYNKINNNFVLSNYWLRSGDYFKIQNVVLAYNIPSKLLKSVKIRAAKIFVKGANLATFSKIKDVDPESISSGVSSYPLFMNFTGGFKLTF
jgi:TonB-linked SusC/RagA family outer membrane protein